MKLTDSDMNHPQFWAVFNAAKKAVRKTLPAQQSDKTAKAMADAVEALTKAMLLSMEDHLKEDAALQTWKDAWA